MGGVLRWATNCSDTWPTSSKLVFWSAASADDTRARLQSLTRPPFLHAPPPQVHVANAAEYAGSRAFAITLRDCVFEDNTLNVTGAVAAQENLTVDLKLIGSGEVAGGSASGRLGRVWRGRELMLRMALTCCAADPRSFVGSTTTVSPALPAR